MPLKLDTPFNPGDIDPGASYSHLQIVSMEWSLAGQITITYLFGVIASGTFVPGKVDQRSITIRDHPKMSPPGTDYTTMLTALPAAGETIYQGVGRELYTFVINQGFAGTIE